MAVLHGRGGRILLQGSGSTADRLVQADSYTLSYDQDLVDVAVLGDVGHSFIPGLYKWQVGLVGNLDTTSNLIWDAAAGITAVHKMYLYPDFGNLVTDYYYGSGWVKSWDVKGGITGKIGVTAMLQGDGALSKN